MSFFTQLFLQRGTSSNLFKPLDTELQHLLPRLATVQDLTELGFTRDQDRHLKAFYRAGMDRQDQPLSEPFLDRWLITVHKELPSLTRTKCYIFLPTHFRELVTHFTTQGKDFSTCWPDKQPPAVNGNIKPTSYSWNTKYEDQPQPPSTPDELARYSNIFFPVPSDSHIALLRIVPHSKRVILYDSHPELPQGRHDKLAARFVLMWYFAIAGHPVQIKDLDQQMQSLGWEFCVASTRIKHRDQDFGAVMCLHLLLSATEDEALRRFQEQTLPGELDLRSKLMAEIVTRRIDPNPSDLPTHAKRWAKMNGVVQSRHNMSINDLLDGHWLRMSKQKPESFDLSRYTSINSMAQQTFNVQKLERGLSEGKAMWNAMDTAYRFEILGADSQDQRAMAETRMCCDQDFHAWESTLKWKIGLLK